MKKLPVYAVLLFMLFPSSAFSHEISLNMGILKVIDALPLIAAKDRGLFSDQGLDVKLISFNSALERDAALSAGQIDGSFTDLVSIIFLNRAGADLRVIAQSYHTTQTSRMFALLASPTSNITTIKRIKDTPVAISNASIIEYLLDVMADSNNIPTEKIKRIEVRSMPIRYQMLINNTVDLALLPEPLVSMAVNEGAQVVADDRRLDMTETVIAIKRDTLEKNPGLYPGFIKAYTLAVQMINAKPAAFMDLMVRETRFPVALKDSFTLPDFPEPACPPEKEIAQVESWLKAKGLMDKEIPYKDIVWEKIPKP
ncbi:MAG: MetQ/NlpA family ABC transporter substrate-binding protein [Thermodesulfobacteriota bacterium]|nr:MetQ/NlpA family ABC transporter substrate-binding protein [Thermodesulfobacteriota bacterium]